MIPDGLAYLATPYSRFAGGIDKAYKDACKLAAHLLIAGVKVYSPIAHTHGIAIYGALDALDPSIWIPFDEAMMAAADVLIVAHLEGWDESIGIEHEIRFFEAAGKPIFDLDPKTVIMKRRPMPSEVGSEKLLLPVNLAHGKTRSEQGGASV
jgi:Domain of unknown function (DUF1937)